MRFELWGLGVQGSGFRVQGPEFRVQGSGFRVQGLGFWVLGSGLEFRVWGVADAATCVWVSIRSTLDAVYVYVVPWSEFPIDPSYPHYPQRLPIVR